MNDEASRLKCEAEYWSRKARQNGRAWWDKKKERIRKKRGEKGLNYLLEAMNNER